MSQFPGRFLEEIEATVDYPRLIRAAAAGSAVSAEREKRKYLRKEIKKLPDSVAQQIEEHEAALREFYG